MKTITCVCKEPLKLDYSYAQKISVEKLGDVEYYRFTCKNCGTMWDREITEEDYKTI